MVNDFVPSLSDKFKKLRRVIKDLNKMNKDQIKDVLYSLHYMIENKLEEFTS